MASLSRHDVTTITPKHVNKDRGCHHPTAMSAIQWLSLSRHCVSHETRVNDKPRRRDWDKLSGLKMSLVAVCSMWQKPRLIHWGQPYAKRTWLQVTCPRACSLEASYIPVPPSGASVWQGTPNERGKRVNPKRRCCRITKVFVVFTVILPAPESMRC